jgi:hypothetical protein
MLKETKSAAQCLWPQVYTSTQALLGAAAVKLGKGRFDDEGQEAKHNSPLGGSDPGERRTKRPLMFFLSSFLKVNDANCDQELPLPSIRTSLATSWPVSSKGAGM